MVLQRSVCCCWRMANVLPFLLVVFEVVGVCLFAVGFFPRHTRTTWEDPEDSITPTNTHERLTPRFDRLVILLIDALRPDFAYPPTSPMSFFHDLVATQRTLSFVAHAAVPTVTLPRIKALTTGTIPAFLDVALNFAPGSVEMDDILTQIAIRERKSEGHRRRERVFYGDETWKKLFPWQFTRVETTSGNFFITDTVEVDRNITRHLEEEVHRDDWEVMILHYLGVDHVGHTHGPSSLDMKAKLEEMDQVVRELHTGIVQSDHVTNTTTLLVLCSDHGMTAGGHHGGASESETQTVMSFMGSAFETRGGSSSIGKVSQVDLAVTLALLLGVPIPKQSIGKIIPELFGAKDHFLAAVRQNAIQLASVLTQGVYVVDGHTKQLEELFGMAQQADTENASDMYWKFCVAASDHMTSGATGYRSEFMVAGCGVLCLTLFVSALWLIKRHGAFSWTLENVFILAGTLFHAISLTSSSRIEEEHFTWYFLFTTWCILLARQTVADRRPIGTLWACALIVLCRVARSWNQTGVKWASEPDLVGWLGSSESGTILTTSHVVAGVVLLLLNVATWRKGHGSGTGQTLCSCLATVSMLLYKNQPTPGSPVGVTLARVVFLLTILSLIGQQPSSKFVTVNAVSFTNVVCLVTKAENVPLIVGSLCMCRVLMHLLHQYHCGDRLSFLTSMMGIVWLGNVLFFTMGNSNSLGTVDFRGSYAGMTSFSLVPVGFLTFLNTYSGPLLVAISCVPLHMHSTSPPISPIPSSMLLITLQALRLAVMCSVCHILRFHLFIWTVFAPKFLYEVGGVVAVGMALIPLFVLWGV